MRVIAGTARGCNLAAPKGLTTRPTSDRLKENFFNIITPSLAGARFLDLFSGSGAMGIEALSRGARTAVLVEHDRTAAVIIKKNLEKTRLTDRAELLCQSVEHAVRQLAHDGRVFDIVFMDPPYAGSGVKDTLSLLARCPILAEDGLLAAELPAGEEVPVAGTFTVSACRVYGRGQFVFYAGGH